MDLLEKRPTQLAYIGLVVARWAYVEQAMAFLYDYLLAQKEQEPRRYGWPVDGLGVASFSAVRSIRTKIDLLSLAIEWRLGSDLLDDFRKGVARKIEAASSSRNIVAHGVILIDEDKPDAIVFELNGKDSIYSERDFVSILDKIADAYESVVSFHNNRARSLLQSPTAAP